MVDTRFLSRAALYLVALAVALIGAVALPALAADTTTNNKAAPMLTIADGPVQVLRGAARFDAAEGLALADDDIVRTGDTTRVARIEFADGRVLDLGPGTQALMLSDAAASSQGLAGAGAVLAQGWAKLTAASGAPARLAMPSFVAVANAGGAVLVQAAADGSTLMAFAESRSTLLLPRGNGHEQPLREGEVWTRDAQSPSGAVSTRSARLSEVPRALADTLPRRAARLAGRDVEPGEGQPLAPADLAPWLRAEPALLAQLRPRLATLARQSLAPTGGVKTVVAHSGKAVRKSSAAALARSRPAAQRVAAGSSLRPGLVLPAPSAALAPAAPIVLPPTALLAPERVLAADLPTAALRTPSPRQ